MRGRRGGLYELEDLSSPEDAKMGLIVEIGLSSSSMLRVFEKAAKDKFKEELIKELPRIFCSVSEAEYLKIHAEICHWGIRNIKQSRRIGGGDASYGQIAKTIDVALKVLIYYCHLPGCERSGQLSNWLNAAVDTPMLDRLRKTYPRYMSPWPDSLKQVDESAYFKIQRLVREFIEEKHHGEIIPVQFDDI